MHVGNALIQHVRTLPEQTVDGSMYHFLIAWHWRCGQNHRIAWHDTNLSMVLVGNTRQGRGWFPLAPSTDDDHLIRMKLVDILNPNDHPLGHVQVAQFYRHLDIVDHTATRQRDVTFVTGSRVHHLLNPRDQRGKGGYNDASRRIGKDLVQRIIADSLRWGIARRLYTRAISHHDQHAFVAKLSQHPKIRWLAINWRIVKFIVTSVNHGSYWCTDHDTYGIGNAVIYAKELCTTIAQFHLISWGNHINGHFIEQPVLLQLDLNQSLR